MEKELLVFKNLPKGKEFRPISEILTEERLRNFAQAIDTDNPLHLDREYAKKTRFGNLIAPPMIAYLLFRRSYLADAEMPGGGVGLKMEFEFLKAAKVNETLITQTRVIDSYEREGKKYVTLEGTTKNTEGDQIYISRLYAIWPK
jgi:3-hydroxybutyryl-CoA dehydratase